MTLVLLLLWLLVATAHSFSFSSFLSTGEKDSTDASRTTEIGIGGASKYPIYADESLMKARGHGSCPSPVQANLRWNCDLATANSICCHNRHYAERSSYWQQTSFVNELNTEKEITFYDSVSGKPLFIAPRGRTMKEFREESEAHGWPSFRDEEVVWENVRCLKNGEAISIDGTHLGHNLPDRKGNRYCINLVSIAGRAAQGESVDNGL